MTPLSDKMTLSGILMICHTGFRLLSERNSHNIYSVKKNKYVIKFHGGFKVYPPPLFFMIA